MQDWLNWKCGEWREDRTEFPGAYHVSVRGNMVNVFHPAWLKGLGGVYRFRRIKGKMVRTG